MSLQDQKRVTVRLKCANPLFEEWLISWKEQAAAKESKMQYIFNHALQSLRKYPLPLESGRDCKLLKGFGDKLCKMLDDKLKQHKRIHGTVNTATNIFPVLKNDTEKTVVKNSKNHILNGTKKAGSTTKQYIPQYGSGGYAILITLYKQSLEPHYPGFLSKTEIIQHGKHLVNSSFTKPDQGSRYTAWSSMRTLISKNLVSKNSHPPKFSLTQEGEMLARKLNDNCNENRIIEQIDGNIIHKMSESCVNKTTLKTKFAPEEYVENITNNFKTYDVDIPDEFTDELLRNTWVTENDTFSLNNECSDANSVELEDKYKKNCDTAVNLRSNTEENCSETNKEGLGESYKNILKPSDSVEYVETSRQASSNMACDRFLSARSVSSQENSCESEPISLKHNGTKSFQKFSSASSISSVKSVTDMSSKNKQNTLLKFASSSSVISTTSTVTTIENFVMAPNSFDIILYVDNHETSGSSNGQPDEILATLTKQGIKCEVTDLKVGDFLWICRDRITKKELVLPYILERKRMDDFAHSIKDKRYHEQKFRLKKSGIENLIYLVESHGKNQHLGLPLQTLYQATTNTAIQENFFIKFTENTKETVEYLVNFSRMLIKMFQSKTLVSSAKDDMQPVDMNDDLISLITFKELNETSVKNKRMKVTELFVKILIQIKGMSVERALAITQIYPTPILLRRIYQEKPGSIGEKLLSGIKYGKAGKSIGIVLSKIVYQAFCKTQY